MTKEYSTTSEASETYTDKTKAILDAAIKVFSDKGYYGSRVSDIAQEAGIAYGLVYHYFKKKEDLLISIFNTRWKELLDAIKNTKEEMDDPREMLRKIISFIFHSYKNNPNMIKVMVVDVAKSTSFFNGDNVRHFTDAFTLLSEIIKMGQKKGIFKKDIDSVLAAYAVYGSIERIMLRWILEDTKSITDSEAKSATNMLTSIVLSGLDTGPD